MDRKFAQAIVFFFAITAIAYGILRGEVGVVLIKAINICMECIGLGR